METCKLCNHPVLPARVYYYSDPTNGILKGITVCGKCLANWIEQHYTTARSKLVVANLRDMNP